MVDGANWFTGKDTISGGILSIASIYEESVKLKHIHKADGIMVTQPSAHLLLTHTQFPNDINVFRFEQLKRFKKLSNVLIHIPEYLFNKNLIQKLENSINYLKPDSIHLNILNQSIHLMPTPDSIIEILDKGFKITQTTAHEQYTNKTNRDLYRIPLHKLSVYATPERYNFRSRDEKEDLILLSPDVVELKQEIIAKLKQELPQFKIVIIQDITYLEYLNLIEKAKYMITFGEGLDFYFIETVFSGGVSYACYNEQFFTKDFESLYGVYGSYKIMLENVINNINELELNISQYNDSNTKQFNACHNIYNEVFYKENLSNFYKNNYLFP
ncbi:MAG: hypothetical protein N4A74_11555 [Carboxylicivirga sp.]|jgi:hypothetical protein|nr:hypothetical protein [Carboxylicivirga sp.]